MIVGIRELDGVLQFREEHAEWQNVPKVTTPKAKTYTYEEVANELRKGDNAFVRARGNVFVRTEPPEVGKLVPPEVPSYKNAADYMEPAVPAECAGLPEKYYGPKPQWGYPLPDDLADALTRLGENFSYEFVRDLAHEWDELRKWGQPQATILAAWKGWTWAAGDH